MAKAATKKRPNTSKPAKPKKLSAAKSSRVPPAKSAAAAKTPGARKTVAKASVPAKKTRAVRAPVISKDELRNQIEKLTAANLTLKAKSRETAKALKAAEARIAVLEHQISQSEVKPVDAEEPAEKVKPPRKTRTPKIVNPPAPAPESLEEIEELPDSDTI